jgi:hypothetical protein
MMLLLLRQSILELNLARGDILFDVGDILVAEEEVHKNVQLQ